MSGWFRDSPRSYAAVVSLAYLGVGLVWIGFSDQVGSALFATGEAVRWFQTWKGTAFVAATALLIFLLLDRRAPERAPPVPAHAGAPLGVWLASLVLATALPLLALIGYNIARETRLALQDANSLVRSVAAGTAADVDALFAGHERVVALLNHQALPERGDPAGCERLLTFAARIHEHLRAVLVLGADGAPVCAVGEAALAARMPPGLAVRIDAPMLSPPVRSSQAGWTFTVTYPLRGGDGAQRALALVVSSAALERVLMAPLPAGSATTLVDRDGVILARAPDAGLVGTRTRDMAAFQQMLRGETILVQGRDGVERVYAVRPVRHLGLYTVAGVASEHVYGPARDNALRLALAGLTVLLVAGMVVARISRKVTGPMAALARTAERVAGGDLAQRAPEGGPAEVARVAVQFNRMLDQLPALERQLRDSELRHRTLLDKLSRNIPGMIFQFRVGADGAATVPFASHGIHRMFEATPEQAGLHAAVLQERIHPDDAARVGAATEESLRTLDNFSVEYRVVLPEGGTRHYLTHSQPERQEDGAVLWHGCTVDVTELELARQALARLNTELEARVRERTAELAAANEALESFSYSVAHDLRAPLEAIAGFSGALAAALERGDTARVQHLCARIAANAVKMNEMIAGLLALARAGRGRPADRPRDLHALAQSVLADLQLPPGVQVRVAPLPVAAVDAATMRQVFWNLLSNAAKFAARRADARVEVGWEDAGEEAAFFVRDNGVGFEPALAGKLFAPFQRLHAHEGYEGTGIGLAIVRRVVEWHGGRVWAEGSVDGGATFWFTLPARRVTASPPTDPAP